MANSSKPTNYVMGETVSVTITAKVSSGSDGTLTLLLAGDQYGSKYLTLTADDTYVVERLIPAEGRPQAGEVWRDRRGMCWFATDVKFIDPNGKSVDQDVVMNDFGPIELVMRSQVAEVTR